MSTKDCIDCTLPVTTYKQYIQTNPERCEFCHVATLPQMELQEQNKPSKDQV